MSAYIEHDALRAARLAHDLRRLVRSLSDDETLPDRVGLSLAADTLDAVSDALDRHWWVVRPILDEREGTSS